MQYAEHDFLAHHSLHKLLQYLTVHLASLILGEEHLLGLMLEKMNEVGDNGKHELCFVVQLPRQIIGYRSRDDPLLCFVGVLVDGST